LFVNCVGARLAPQSGKTPSSRDSSPTLVHIAPTRLVHLKAFIDLVTSLHLANWSKAEIGIIGIPQNKNMAAPQYISFLSNKFLTSGKKSRYFSFSIGSFLIEGCILSMETYHHHSNANLAKNLPT
jgi:hypothetical protein